MSTVLSCKNVTKRFGSVTAVNNFSLTLEQGELISLLGPSGCGKTTLLRLLAGFVYPEEGEIEISGKKVNSKNLNVPPEKRGLGMVFQDYALFPHLTVEKNIQFGLKNGDKNGTAQKYMSLLGLEGLESRMPSELSGGQQQRVALARALAPGADVLLLDEPFSNLDASLRVEVREEILDILKSNNISTIFVTHDQEEAFFMGDRVAVMKDGELEQIGSAYEVYHAPYSRFIAEFVGTADFLSVYSVLGKASTILGDFDPPASIANQDELEIMVRPDDVAISLSGECTATIISSAFQGDSYLYRILLDSGQVIHCSEHHALRFEPGAKVSVSIAPHHSPLFFQNAKRVL